MSRVPGVRSRELPRRRQGVGLVVPTRGDLSCLLPRRPIPRSCPHAERRRRAADSRRPREDELGCDASGGVDGSSLRAGLEGPQAPQGLAPTPLGASDVSGGVADIDIYKAPMLLSPGHRVTDDRDQNGRARGLGNTVVIAVEDDHSHPSRRQAPQAPRTPSTADRESSPVDAARQRLRRRRSMTKPATSRAAAPQAGSPPVAASRDWPPLRDAASAGCWDGVAPA